MNKLPPATPYKVSIMDRITIAFMIFAAIFLLALYAVLFKNGLSLLPTWLIGIAIMLWTTAMSLIYITNKIDPSINIDIYYKLGLGSILLITIPVILSTLTGDVNIAEDSSASIKDMFSLLMINFLIFMTQASVIIIPGIAIKNAWGMLSKVKNGLYDN